MMEFDTVLDATRAKLFPGRKDNKITTIPQFLWRSHPPRKVEYPFLAVRLKIIQSHQDPHLAAFP